MYYKHKHKIMNTKLSNEIKQYMKSDNESYYIRFIPGMQGWYNIQVLTNVTQTIERIKDKIHMITLMSAEKYLTKLNTH